jgi:hypothetical protein
MNQSARVNSIDALKEFRVALCKFGQVGKEAICSVDLELRRTLDWVEGQVSYWQRELRKREEEYVRAKSELTVRRHSRNDDRGTTELELAMEEALRRYKHAEMKLDSSRQWSRELPRLFTEYEGPAHQLAGMLDAELAQGAALLQQKVNALEAYVATLAPSLPAAPAAPSKDATPAETPPPAPASAP